MLETLLVRVAGNTAKMYRWIIAIFVVTIINTIGLIVLLGNQQQTYDVTKERVKAVKTKIEEATITCSDVATEVEKKLSK